MVINITLLKDKTEKNVFFCLQSEAQSLNGKGSTVPHTLSSSSSKHGMQMKVTRMLIVVSSAFLILNLPSHGMRIYTYVLKVSQDDRYLDGTTQAWQYIAMV